MTVIWCMVTEIWSMTDKFFCHFGLIFLPFYPPNNPKSQNFEKMKKRPGDIIISHMCTINHNDTMYGSWYIEHDGQIFLSFRTIFCLFTPWTAWKIKISKKWKKNLQISSLYTSVPQIMIIWYTVPELWHMTDVNFIFHFGLLFALLPPWQYAILFLRYDVWQM